MKFKSRSSLVLRLATCLWGACLLAPGAWAERSAIFIDSFPSGARVYLETSSGPQFVGLSGTTVEIQAPGLRNPQGQVTQYFSGYLTLEAPQHDRLRVSISSEEWKEHRLPARGRYQLGAQNWLVSLKDALLGYPVQSLLVALGLAVAVWSAFRWRKQSFTKTREVESLVARLTGSGDPLIGKLLGQFEVLARLGQGGMGTVYKVRGQTGEELAAKVVYRDAQTPDFDSRFRREARLLSQLNHPNLVRLVDFGETSGILYYAMELVNGKTLAECIQPGGMTWAEVLPVARQILLGLHYAHGKGIVHRDLKPGNIMIASDGKVKVLDFGLAREKSVTAITMTGQAFGTPTYISPEQINARSDEIEPKSDQYSFGIMLFEMLTGVPPFQSEDPSKLVTMHLTYKPPLLRSLRPELPLELESVISRMLAKDTLKRYPDLQAVVHALDSLPEINGEPSSEVQGKAPRLDATVAIKRP